MAVSVSVLRSSNHTPVRAVEPPRIAALALACGGTGIRAAKTVRDFHNQDGRAFPLRLIGADTDKIDAPWLNREIPLSLSAADINVLRANPENFSPAVQLILDRHPKLLDEEHSQHGARTVRPLSQIAFEYFRDQIVLA